MRIAIDAMGGDYAPESIVKGINLAKKEFPNIEFQLYGEPEAIKAHLEDEKNVKKEKEWTEDIKRLVDKSNQRSKRLAIKFRKSIPKSETGKFLVKMITSYISNKYKRKIKKVDQGR